MSTAYIYALIDPDTEEINYIGKATVLTARLSMHCSKSREMRSEKDIWINSLLQQGKRPIITTIEECVPGTWKERECYWIEHYRSLGVASMNIDDGGRGSEAKDRPSPYPIKILVRLTGEMGKRMDQVIDDDPTQTQVGIVRKALDKYLPKLNKLGKPSPQEDD